MEKTTIRLSKKIKRDLKKLMIHPKDTYESVIARLLYMSQPDDFLSEKVIKDIKKGMADIKAGRVYTTEQVKKRLGLR